MQALGCWLNWLKVLAALTGAVIPTVYQVTLGRLVSLPTNTETSNCTNKSQICLGSTWLKVQHGRKKRVHTHWIIELLSAEDMLVFAGSAGFLCRK